MAKPYIGVGIKHPHEVDQFGKIALTEDKQLIDQSLVILFNTPIGTDFGREHFGSNIRQAMFEPNNQIVRTLLDYYIADAIQKWEKRIRLVDIKYEVPVDQPALINCTIIYLIKQASEINSFIYPFYRELNN